MREQKKYLDEVEIVTGGDEVSMWCINMQLR